ncbi:MAG TPA: hypothetical protein HPQ04_00060 [Rhodospirillaceae bacterium]|nr:hypothetical protein [Rhodospirillaceae bacterium]
MSSSRTRSEVVGIFSTRRDFDCAVQSLLAAGFQRSDISVLASHDSIDAAQTAVAGWKERLVALVGELKYEGPLITAGLIALATGPVGAAIAALIAAGVGGAAVKEFLDEVTAKPHSEDFVRALEAGSLLLWVDIADPARRPQAIDILTAAGGANVHANQRSA